MTKSNQKNDENQGKNDGKQSEKRIHFYAKINGNEKWTLSDFNDWIASEESYTKIQYPIGCTEDCSELKYFPNDKIIIPVPTKLSQKKIWTQDELKLIEDEIIISINAGNLSKNNFNNR